MMSPTDRELLEHYLDGTIDDADAQRLRSLLRDSAEARAALRTLATVDFGLQEIAAIGAIPETAKDEGRPSVLRFPKPSTTTRRHGWPLAIAAAAALLFSHIDFAPPVTEAKVARISGMGGSVLWTGNGGRVTGDLGIGDLLTGGTVEGTTPDSWVELEFIDGSTAMISGNSMLTFSDHGQKQLYLKEGAVSGDVKPQSPGKPMRIQTRSALLEVLGTQFQIETDLSSTVLNVNQGEVRVKRLSDGRTVDVPAEHRLIAALERPMVPEAIPGTVRGWKSRLDLGPAGTQGRWSPKTAAQDASLKTIPYVHTTPQGQTMTLYSAALQVSGGDNPPVILDSDSRIRVRGRLGSAHGVVFGVTVRHPDGGFAGNFFTFKPASAFEGGGDFDVLLEIRDFRLDPLLAKTKNQGATAPVGVVAEAFWCNSLADPAGLEIVEVEVIAPASAAS